MNDVVTINFVNDVLNVVSFLRFSKRNTYIANKKATTAIFYGSEKTAISRLLLAVALHLPGIQAWTDLSVCIDIFPESGSSMGRIGKRPLTR